MAGLILPWRRHVRETLVLAVPVAVGQLGHVALSVVDSAMVGQTGAVPLAASALVHGLFMLLYVTGVGISLAITPLVAAAHGRGDAGETWRVLRHGLLMNLAFGVLFVAGGFALAEAIPLLGQTAEVAAQGRMFMRIMALCYVPMMAYHALRQFAEGLGYTRPAMYIVIAANAVNAFLNWVLIYGHLGAPALGLAGSGWSTVVTECAMVFVLAVFVLRARRFAAARAAAGVRTLDRALLGRLLAIGVPGGLQYLFEVSAFVFSAVMVGWMGSTALAAHQIAMSMASTTYMIILGLSAAATIRVGTAFGAGDHAGVRRAGLTAIGFAASVMAVFGCVFVVWHDALPRLFVSDPAVIPVAGGLLLIAAVFQMMDGVQAVSMGALRGFTDVRIPSLISLVAYWVVGIPVGWLLGIAMGRGVSGVWIGFIFGLLTSSTFFLTRFVLLTRRLLYSSREI